MTARPTPAQIAALRLASVRPIVTYYGPGSTGASRTIVICRDREWLAMTAPKGHLRHWTITDAGRAILATIDAKDVTP